MKSPTIIISLCLLSSILLVGCGTPYRKQVRNDANERYNLVNAQMQYDQAKQAYSTGQFKKALKSINAAIVLMPTMPNYHVIMGRVYLETHKLELSMLAFEKAIEIDENYAEAHYFTGIIYQRWSKFGKARNAYRNAFEIDEDNVQYLMATAETMISLQQYEEAKQFIGPYMAHFEYNSALRQLLGQLALLQKDPVTAAKLFHDARLLNPEDELLLEELANAQFAAGQYAQAHYSIKQLQELSDKDRADLLLIEARCLSMTDRAKEARNIYLKLTQLTPADPNAWIELGNVAYEVGDHRRVALCSTRAIALAPNRYEGYLLKGLYEQHASRPQEAIILFRKASDIAPATAWPHLLLGMMLEEQGRKDEALHAYAAALRAEPENQEAHRLFQGLDGITTVPNNSLGIQKP